MKNINKIPTLFLGGTEIIPYIMYDRNICNKKYY